MDPTDELFIILKNCNDWNDTCNYIVQNCIDKGADLIHIHQKYNTVPLLYGIQRQLHPECIKLLISNGVDERLKIKYSDYIYDSYVGIEYNVTQYKTIKNTLLELYYSSIGENIENHLVELFTERDYILNVLHYPLDLSDYREDIDEISEQITPNISFIESDLDTQNHDMSIYDSINNLVPYNYIIKKTNIKINYKLIEYIKEYCIIFNYDYNTISEWKLEVPDDFTKYR